ncbi:conserved oligomeric Golgi complex subunit 1-like isoform X2 [Symsagittifera roscoffensis]|uniref:conserved oligomeric Golgi complex subunit 1-like isoform X2 n=1 Tax=Symsagittifera roscoffensis TaxID=84072 RepID=UPI00307C22EE
MKMVANPASNPTTHASMNKRSPTKSSSNTNSSSSPGVSSGMEMERRVESLFETQTVSEVRGVERRFHSDIDRKRQDLRLLVGERYKDVIDVSDKLTGITAHSEQVKSRLERMQSLCEDLKKSQERQKKNLQHQEQKQSQEFTSGVNKEGDGTIGNGNRSALEVACQLRLLSLMPENVLLFLDKCEYVKASQLVSFSQSLRSSLTDPLSSPYTDTVKTHFPILHRISTQHIHSALSQTMQRNMIAMVTAGPLAKPSSDNAAEANNGLCTKENAAHFCRIVEAFSILYKSFFIDACVQCLELFSDHMVHILTDADTSQSVGDILTMVSRIYHFVVYCIEYTVEFVTDSSKNDESLMSHKFDDLYPTQTQLKNFLPTDIRNVSFAPTILDQSEIEGFKKEVSSHIEEYLVNRIRKYVDDQLSYVKTIKSLTKIKTELTRIEQESIRFENSTSEPVGQFEDNSGVNVISVNIWQTLFEPLFASCVQKLVKKGALDQWTEVLALLEDKLAPLTSSHHPHSQRQRGDSDMPSHVWNEEVLLTHPSQSLGLSSEGGEKSSKGVERGSSGGVGNAWSSSHTETPAIVSVCNKIDEIVDVLCESGRVYFQSQTQPNRKQHQYQYNNLNSATSSSSTGNLSAQEDSGKSAMDGMSEQITLILLQRLIEFLHGTSRDLVEALSNGVNGFKMTRVELELRLMNYLLCNCRCMRNFHRNELTEEVFVQVEQMMKRVQREWLECLCSEALSSLKSHINSATIQEHEGKSVSSKNEDISRQLLAACWEQIEIEEETEEGKTVSTKLNIPIKASYPVHEMLFVLTNGLNRVTSLLTSEFIQRQQRSQRSAHSSSISATPFLFLLAAELKDRLSSDARHLMNEKLVDFYSNNLYQTEMMDTKLAVQIIYDIKFLAVLLANSDDVYKSPSRIGGGGNDESLVAVVGKYEQHVDPFDYDVYSQHMGDKLAQEVGQSQHLYGYLISQSTLASNSINLSSSSTSGPSGSKTSGRNAPSSSHMHNLCQLVSSPNKFQPLSVPHSAASFALKRSATAVSGSAMGSTGGVTGSQVTPTITPDKFASPGSSLLKGWLKG